ncbi:MAG: right-handed parallel beta-helix repeat-containing protein, partial [Kiritimatiellota bacterium]|nr:right-handed parallel beta-helix repeat-containing protein [Kiritimatiellota bacterium]
PQAASPARSRNTIMGSYMFACDWTTCGDQLRPFIRDELLPDSPLDTVVTKANGNKVCYRTRHMWLYFNKLSNVNHSAGQIYIANPAGSEINHNRFMMDWGQAIFSREGGETFHWNIVNGGYRGIWVAGGSNATMNLFSASGNTFKNCVTAIDVENAQYPVKLRNNICAGSGSAMKTTAKAMAVINANYNVLDRKVDANYQPGVSDTTGVDAAIDENYFPIASGNCDGNGDTNVVDWVGGSDPFGLVLVYKATRISRGAREIPAVYPSAELHPDLW